ncbi:MAG: hypothetical protein ABSG43_00400 [Solirubrobacteraceae bacterium]|jgi:hypothetical protein
MSDRVPYYGDSEEGQAGYSAHLRELANQLREESDRARRRGVPQLEAAFREASTTVGLWAGHLAPAREKVRDGDLCVCGHDRERHADPASGDARCLVVTQRSELADVFDDGREGQLGYCACLGFREQRQLALDAEPTRLERFGTTDAGFEERIADAQRAAQELPDDGTVRRRGRGLSL